MAEHGGARGANGGTPRKANKKGKEGGEQADALYVSDVFRMYCYKVLPCTKAYNHNWKVCPFAHEGEKARRRDPRAVRYVGIECPDGKSGRRCPRGDACPLAHNVFEYWLHPTRYRTQLCNEPATCRRKVCFFAHTLEELRKPSLEEIAMIPAAWPADGQSTSGAQAHSLVQPPPPPPTAVSDAQDGFTGQQPDLRRMEIIQRQPVHGQHLVYDHAYDQSQPNLQFGNTSPLTSSESTNNSPVDDAVKELTALFQQHNINNNPSPTGSSQSCDSEQTVGLMLLLQELIRTQQGGKDAQGGRTSPIDPPYSTEMLASHRFSLDGATSAMHGPMGLAGVRLTDREFMQMNPVVQQAIQSAGVRVPALSENAGMIWGSIPTDERKRLSMDVDWQGQQY